MIVNKLLLLKKIFIISVLQGTLCWLVWLVCDVFAVFPSIYYNDIEHLSPFRRAWNEGIINFIEYLYLTFFEILFLWGICFLVNAFIVLKYKRRIEPFFLILIMVSASFLYTYLIFVKLMDMYLLAELIKICISTLLFGMSIFIRKLFRG